jgi:hypothetical protein
MYGPERLDLGIILDSMFRKERKKSEGNTMNQGHHERERTNDR